jgi:NitT/TauT family transport system substrate-binding protein
MRTCVALVSGVLAAVAWLPRPALADDTLTVIGGNSPAAFFEVISDVAERAGFYKAEQLTVTFQYAGNPYIAAQLVATGKGDICSLSIEPIVQGYEKGLRLQGFFARDPHYEYAIAVLDDSPIRSLADFKGALLGETSAGSPGEISTSAMLMGAGLRKSDVSYIPLGAGTQPIPAITGKKVAGLVQPYVQDLIYAVLGHVRFRYFWNPILKDIGDVAYAATPETIQTKADALQRFSRANVKAAILIRENPRLAARYFLQGAGIPLTPEALDNQTRLLELAYDQLPGFDPTSENIGSFSPLGMEVLARFLYDNGVTSQIVPVSAFMTDRFIAYANAFDHKSFIAQVKTLR